jgi:hypothetical protein
MSNGQLFFLFVKNHRVAASEWEEKRGAACGVVLTGYMRRRAALLKK